VESEVGLAEVAGPASEWTSSRRKRRASIRDEEECHSGGIAMSVWTPIMMKMDFVVVPSDTGPKDFLTKVKSFF
jgi:hypothetical protein